MSMSMRAVRGRAVAAAVMLLVTAAGCTSNANDGVASTAGEPAPSASQPPTTAVAVTTAASPTTASGATPIESVLTVPATTVVSENPTAEPGGSPESAATTDGPSAVTGPVAPPGGAGNGDTVPEVVVSTLASTALDATVQLGRVEVTIAETRSVRVEPVGPGEIGGDGLAVTVAYRNGSQTPIDLSTVTVVMTDALGQVTVASTGAPAAVPAGELAPGASAQGVYVFTVAPDRRQPITVTVTDFGNAASAVFTGNVA